MAYFFDGSYFAYCHYHNLANSQRTEANFTTAFSITAQHSKGISRYGAIGGASPPFKNKCPAGSIRIFIRRFLGTCNGAVGWLKEKCRACPGSVITNAADRSTFSDYTVI